MSADDDSWLADVVVINDNIECASAGDVQIFRSVGELIDHVEPWYVEEGHSHFILTGKGKRVRLGLQQRSSWRGTWNDIIVADNGEGGPSDLLTLHVWLRSMAEQVQGPRREKAKNGKLVFMGDQEKDGILPSTVEGLIAYIGFS